MCSRRSVQGLCSCTLLKGPSNTSSLIDYEEEVSVPTSNTAPADSKAATSAPAGDADEGKKVRVAIFLQTREATWVFILRVSVTFC